MKIQSFALLTLFLHLLYAEEYYYKNKTKMILIPEVGLSKNSSGIKYFKNQSGVLIGVTDKIIVKFFNDNNLQYYINDLNLTIERKIFKNLYLLKVKDINKTLEVTNSLSLKKDIIYAHPDFIKSIINR